MDTQSITVNSELSKQLSKAIEAVDSTHKPILLTYEGLPKAVLLSKSEYDTILASSGTERRVGDCSDLEEAYIRLLLAVASAMDVHEDYLAGHTERVAMLACAVAEQLKFSESQINDLRLAALLHDIGEVVIPIDILHSSRKLTPEEYKIIQQHPRVGAEMVKPIKRLEHIANIIYSHQEKIDGSGYPRGLKGEEIPLEARIIAVTDTYDAITNLRFHRESSNHEQAIMELERCKGKVFDSQIVDVFSRLF